MVFKIFVLSESQNQQLIVKFFKINVLKHVVLVQLHRFWFTDMHVHFIRYIQLGGDSLVMVGADSDIKKLDCILLRFHFHFLTEEIRDWIP